MGMKLKYNTVTDYSVSRISDPERRARVGVGIVAVLLFCAALEGSHFNPSVLFEPDSIAAATDFLETFWPPRSDVEFLRRLLDATVVTVAVATVATVLAMIVAIPVATAIASRLSLSGRGRPMNRTARVLRTGLRTLLMILRSVPELIWALLFVGISGLGAVAGVMGLMLTNIGILAKNYAEIIESGDATASAHLLDNGCGRLKTLLYATLPHCLPEWLSYSVYRWECTLRTSVVLGFVGAGGLGQELLISVRQLAAPEVLSIILVFVLLVSMADALSASLRQQFNGVSSNSSYSGIIKRVGWRGVAVSAVILACFHTVDWQLAEWMQPGNVARSLEFVQGIFSPDMSSKLWLKLSGEALETLSMAFAGTALASVVAIVISYLLFVVQLRGGGIVASVLASGIRLAQILLRSIPELVWAMLLIIVAGIGPFTGTLALFLCSVGVLSRLYSECLENQNSAALEQLLLNGSAPEFAPLWSTLLQARSQLISYSLYRWEHNLRAATLMGIVGAGGVGQELYLRLSVFQFDKLAACIWIIVLMVALADCISHFLRHRYAPS